MCKILRQNLNDTGTGPVRRLEYDRGKMSDVSNLTWMRVLFQV